MKTFFSCWLQQSKEWYTDLNPFTFKNLSCIMMLLCSPESFPVNKFNVFIDPISNVHFNWIRFFSSFILWPIPYCILYPLTRYSQPNVYIFKSWVTYGCINSIEQMRCIIKASFYPFPCLLYYQINMYWIPTNLWCKTICLL